MPASLNDIAVLLSRAVREQMREDIAANHGGEMLWWGRVKPAEGSEPDDSSPQAKQTKPIQFVEAAACGNESSVLAHFPYMERGDVVLHNHPSGTVQPSDADLQVAGELAMQGIGFYIVNNQLTRICAVAKPVLQELQPLDIDHISHLLGRDGPLAQKTAENNENMEYEDRPTQQELLRLVAGGFNQSEIVVAEGGTGIGKSFAYLLPAAFWAVRNKQRVVVATATINLQQQLIEKDIPLIREISGLQDLRAELVKGRSNYLCKWRLKQAEAEEGAALGFEEQESLAQQLEAELASISQWAAATQDGSLSDLGFRPQSAVWNQVCGESDNCLGLRCEFYESCFIILARRRAAAAHILVANHHLLFADLDLRGNGEFGYEKTAVLPPYRHVVLDEAHNIERSAQSFFSETLSRFSARRSLHRLYYRSRTRERGIWAVLRPYAELEAGTAENLPDIPVCIQAVEDASARLDDAAKMTLEAAGQNNRPNNNLRIPERQENLPPSVQQALRRQLWPQLERVRTAITTLLQAMRQIHELLENALEGEEQKLLLEWRQLSRRFEALRDTVLHWQVGPLKPLQKLVGGEEPSELPSRDSLNNKAKSCERVFWLERRNLRDAYYHPLLSTQMNIGSLLQQVLYQPMRSVVMVSATLTVQNRFDYWFSRVGLSWQTQAKVPAEVVDEATEVKAEWQKPIRSAAFASPFDYRSRVHLLLASDAPNPSFAGQYDAYVARFAQQAMHSMGGRSLLLFTSYAALNQCYNFLADSLGNSGLDLLCQGDDASARLLQRFKRQESLSLLATDSFWEGVDAPGATLAQVLLCRLPFRSPDDPIVAAHIEYLESRGQNAFFHYSLPEAVLRFRQGFGRLMRRASDSGLVAVLDPRIVHKRYGQDFLSSLPPSAVVCGDFATLQEYIRQYAAANNFGSQ